MKYFTPLLLATLLFVLGQTGNAVEIASPDRLLKITLDNVDSAVAYSVSYRNETVIAPSRLGFELADGQMCTDLTIVGSAAVTSSDTTWKPVYGERRTIRDHYNETTVELKCNSFPIQKLFVTLRAYDEGVALQYTIPKQDGVDSIHIKRELTEFRLPADFPAWATYSAQGEYTQVPISQIKKGCERPLVIEVDNWTPKNYIAIGEAALVDYARMKLAPLAGVDHALVSDLSSEVEAKLPLTTPWRFVMAANSPGELLENNDLVLNLNPPCAIADTSFIKPGKVIREVTLTTQGGKACVDFAAAHNLQYVEFDAGWYGNEYDDASDATTITVDPKRSPGPLDLEEVVRYGKERGIGIIVYVNRRALEKQLDEILPLYKKWGIVGLKYGFVNVGSQEWTSWLHEAIRKAADYEMMVDVHDEYRPTGFSRTYPNFMTQEGIRGDETSPSNELTLTILFTRMLCGAGDNTICYYDARVDKNATHAYQLAKAVCFYSPWQFLYWYDRPNGSPGTPGAGGSRPGIGNEPELKFFDDVPTVWDDTKFLEGEIGKYAVMARRCGDDWFIGVMNSGQDRTFDIPLGFLQRDMKYTAEIYSDDPTVETRTHVRVTSHAVDASTVIKASVSAQGGQAIRITPVRK